MLTCIVCQKTLRGRQKKYCCQACKCKTTNAKHQNYQAQQQRGLGRKIDLVKTQGAACKLCGYNKNLAALCFHHRDPNQKDIQLDMRKLSNAKMETLKNEANKCDLLCHNCHMEQHYPDLDNSLLNFST